MPRYSITGQTRIIGIFGDPIAHSRSPEMQNAAFRACGLPYVYIPFLVHPMDLSCAVQSIRSLNLAGVNVTVPHKENILRHLDSITEEAKLCGAVNTVVNQDGSLLGDNTDGRGFLVSAQARGFDLRGREVIMIGAGGSARAVLVSLIKAGSAKISIANRTLHNAQTLVRTYLGLGNTEIEARSLDCLQDPALLKNVALIVNCTSVGLHGEGFSPLAYTETPQHCLFYDLLYRPEPTSFLARARAAQRQVIDGRQMLLHQGALAFSLWTGQPAPLVTMGRALKAALRRPRISTAS
jgi:shikimate dehydrogenase